MMSSEELLQERLEQLEAGAPLEVCLTDLSEEEAELLKLVAGLREAPYPGRDPNIAAAQRARFLRQMGQENNERSPAPKVGAKAWVLSLRNWLRPRTAFAGAVAVLSLCALIALLALGVFRPSSQDGDVAEISLPEPTSEERVAQKPLPEPTLEPTYKAFVPMVFIPEVQDPASAALRDPRGLVEIQASDGTWTAASARGRIAAGQRVRTGGLSSVRLALNDGSQVRLGPHTEISVEELDARRSDGPRVVVLTQWSGETNHEVAPASVANSRYEVRTPSATGVAKGTAFHVQVTTDLLTRFSVDEGALAVTSLNVTVDVIAGQATTVGAGEAPDAPAFRVTGEGEVTQTGTTWIIAGHTFETHDSTVIVGNLQVGDWVFVEGRLLADDTRVADWIALLRRSPANRFTITGRVDATGDEEWTVAGQTIRVDQETKADEEIKVEDLVRVEGVILQDGTLLAEQIRLLEETPGLPFSFTGVVQEIVTDTWRVSGVIITVDAETVIDEGLEVGDIVNVRGWILDDGTWLARAIERAADVERAFEITGVVDTIDPWSVAGISFETRAWTEIEAGIESGDLVRVKGHILEDGTWVASEIEQLDDEEDEDELHIVFVGTVDDIDPWLVSGIPLDVDDDTVIEEDIEVGALVKVTVRVLPDGTWLATRIELLEVDEGGQGCVYITAVVVDAGSGWIKPDNWPAIEFDGISVEGEIQVGSVILMLVCVDEEGAMDIVSIVVIYQPEPVIVPTPPPPPPPPPGQEEDAKVTICHKPNSKNPHTLTISQSALQAHLDHGDTLGPCP